MSFPKLFLAPMEGVGDRPFRRAMGEIGGFDEACAAFISVPILATDAYPERQVKSLAKAYDPEDTLPAPQAAQIMGCDPDSVALMGRALEERGAPRIDLNCGCPSNTVAGRGAGSSLLKTPDHLYKTVKALVDAVSVPVSAKTRSGYADTSLFDENMQAVQEAGASMVTVHPRTKVDGYRSVAKWEYIRRAKERLRIPVVGSGDVCTIADARRMADETGCDGIMIGRGAISNPWIFREIKAHVAGAELQKDPEALKRFVRTYHSFTDPEGRPKTRINKLKQLVRFMLEDGAEVCRQILQSQCPDPDQFLEEVLRALYKPV